VCKRRTDRDKSEEAEDLVGGEVRAAGPPGRRGHRRVTTQAVPGSDPRPQPEPRRHSENENDERLKDDKPPHWG